MGHLNKTEVAFPLEDTAIAAVKQKLLAEFNLKQKAVALDEQEVDFPEIEDGFWDYDIASRKVTLPPSWMKIFGFKESEPAHIEDYWYENIEPREAVRIRNQFENFLKGHGKFDTTFRLKHRDGSIRVFATRGVLLRDKQGLPYRAVGLSVDISWVNVHRQALIENQKKYRAIFENSQVAIFRTTLCEGIVLEANPKTWELLECEPSTGVDIVRFYADPEERLKLIEQIKEKGKLSNYELPIITCRGNHLWVACSVVLNKEDQVLECVAQDITEMKERLNELQHLNFELDSFVYHASHDLRSPLKSIMGLVNLLEQEQDPEFRKNSMGMIATSIRKLDNLVEDLLSISRNKKLSVRKNTFDFETEIESCLENFSYSEDIKGLEVRINVQQPVAFVSDLSRIRIIFNNLISNAIKYRSFIREQSFVEIAVEVDKQKAIVRVQDNGEGIPEKLLPQIFEMFYRASEKSGGSGLGLYIVQKVVDTLYGKVEVESKVGVGTTFRLEIPNLLE